MKTSAALACAFATLIIPRASAQTAASETGVVLPAAELLPADLLRGPSHRVRDQVVTDGYLAHFQIDSDFGVFKAIGVPQAKQRIAEVAAIRKLVETSKGDLFAEGLKRSVEQPIDAVKNIVGSPVESIKQAPKTVGHFFGKVGSAIGRGVNKVVDSSSGDGPKPGASEVGAGVTETAKNVAGFDKARLDTAKQLGVDPYSDNPRLQEEMDKVTWAFFAGGLPLRLGAALASGGASMALTATNMVGIPEDTYALTSSELALRDQRALEAMGVRAADIDKFQIHSPLSVTRRHRIVTALQALPKTSGRGNAILLANACASPEQAEFLASAIAMLAERQAAGKADYQAIKVIGRLPGALTGGGELHVPAPVDHVTWTEDVAAAAMRDDLGPEPRLLVHSGRLSPAAAAGFAAAGWKTEAVPYPTR